MRDAKVSFLLASRCNDVGHDGWVNGLRTGFLDGRFGWERGLAYTGSITVPRVRTLSLLLPSIPLELFFFYGGSLSGFCACLLSW